MENSGYGRPYRFRKFIAVLSFLLLLLFVSSISAAVAASGGEGGSKAWEWGDTYRVMNFAVLVIALVFLLRKPLSQAR